MKIYGRGKHWSLYALMLCSMPLFVSTAKAKRQIFREQVLPALGGKVPDEAFRTDRLALNRLNKEGITVPDGVVLDSRRVHRHPHPGMSTSMPEILQVYLTPDGRYVPSEGRHHYGRPKAIDTTYVIQRPFIPHSKYNDEKSTLAKTTTRVYKPVVHPLLLPTATDARLYATQQPYLPTSWSIGYPWATAPYDALEDHHTLDNYAPLDSPQILVDYDTYLSKFHGRFLRYVRSNADSERTRLRIRRREAKPAARRNSSYRGGHSAYANITGLTGMPKTNFSCDGRKGTFADIASKCQVYHECFGWSRKTSLCPSGTVFDQVKKRCERSHIVKCRRV